MIKNKKKYNIILIILQALKKMKNKIVLKNLHKSEKSFLIFLWLNKYIYGYNRKKIIIIYLKNNRVNNNLYINKYNKKINIKEIKKISNWSKNSFFIIKTNKGIFHQKTNMNLKIGGYLLYKIC